MIQCFHSIHVMRQQTSCGRQAKLLAFIVSRGRESFLTSAYQTHGNWMFWIPYLWERICGIKVWLAKCWSISSTLIPSRILACHIQWKNQCWMSVRRCSHKDQLTDWDCVNAWSQDIHHNDKVFGFSWTKLEWKIYVTLHFLWVGGAVVSGGSSTNFWAKRGGHPKIWGGKGVIQVCVLVWGGHSRKNWRVMQSFSEIIKTLLALLPTKNEWSLTPHIMTSDQDFSEGV